MLKRERELERCMHIKAFQGALSFHLEEEEEPCCKGSYFSVSESESECLFCVMEATSNTNIKSKSRPINPLGGLSDHHHLPWKFMFIR